MNEHKALVSMIDSSFISDKVILIADRGYESFNDIAHCQGKTGITSFVQKNLME